MAIESAFAAIGTSKVALTIATRYYCQWKFLHRMASAKMRPHLVSHNINVKDSDTAFHFDHRLIHQVR